MGMLGEGIEAGEAGVGLLGGIFGRSEKYQAQKKSIQEQLKEEQDASDIRTTQQLQRLNEINAAQTAIQSVSGFTLSSPSFNAIQMDSINNYAEDQNAQNLQIDFDKINAANQLQNDKDEEIWGDINSGISMGDSMHEGYYRSSSALPKFTGS